MENRRLAYTESMSDEDGRVLAPPDLGMAPDHPTVTEVIVELDDLDGRTRMTLTHRGVPADSPVRPDGPWLWTSSPRSWHQLREPACSMIAFSAERSLVVARRIARATKGAVSDPNPLGDPVLRKVIKVPPWTASQV